MVNTILLKQILKNNKFIYSMYLKYKSFMYRNNFKIDSIRVPNPIEDTNEKLRVNLVLVDLQKTGVFGGSLTAQTIIKELADLYNSDSRIILIGNDKYNKKLTYNIEGYKHNYPNKGLYYLSENNNIDVRKNDLFIFTFWTTAYSFINILEWQKKQYNIYNRKAVYLIQDYEPGFYQWSTEYVLAESTYNKNCESLIAIFNSEELSNYFKINGYTFAHELYFKPCINDKLKEILLTTKPDTKRLKRILIYGRPGVARNAFEIIQKALMLWSKKYFKASEWEIISLGEKISTIQLERNRIVSCGKVSLEEYANYMLTAYVGISLMISPHPSYPPLEMSTFGVKTITNTFLSKDLTQFNENIISLKSYTPDDICNCLISICSSYENNNSLVITEGEYIVGDSFHNMIISLGNILNEMLAGE